MSPSSAGSKPTTPPTNTNNNGPVNGVERYIGSYLISTKAHPTIKNNFRPKNNGANIPRAISTPDTTTTRYITTSGGSERWVGGAPLFTSYQQQQQQQQCRGNIRKNTNLSPVLNTGTTPNCARTEKFHQQTQLSRLALHTQGIPLILAGRTTNPGSRKNYYPSQKCLLANSRNTNISVYCNANNSMQNEHSTNPKSSVCDNFKDNSSSVMADTLSVASDESSGSANSENCLPRIIKPRKRRKKDRKPSITTTASTSLPSSSSSSVETTSNHQRVSTPSNTNNTSVILNVQIKTINNNNYSANCDTVPDIPNLNHVFDDIKEDIFASPSSSPSSVFHSNEPANPRCPIPSSSSSVPTSCQCKLCDPSGQIWNVDSTFLNKTTTYYATPHPRDDDVDNFIVDKMVSALRRSWSDPIATNFHNQPEYNNNNNTSTIGSRSNSVNDVGVIGSGRHPTPRVDRSIIADNNHFPIIQLPECVNDSVNSTTTATTTTPPPNELNISTEIVTSHNGHRDLEIKFLSFSSVNKSIIGADDHTRFYDNLIDEKDCDLSYDTTEISRLLLNVEE